MKITARIPSVKEIIVDVPLLAPWDVPGSGKLAEGDLYQGQRIVKILEGPEKLTDTILQGDLVGECAELWAYGVIIEHYRYRVVLERKKRY